MNALFYNLEPNCYAMLIKDFIKNGSEVYMDIMESIDFEHKSIPLPRLTSFHSTLQKVYKYSGIVNMPKEMLPIMNKLCEQFKEISSVLGVFDINAPNSCLVNYYRNGNDYIGWHSDDEQKTYITNPIYSISLGDERVFQLRNKTTETITDIPLPDGSLLIMYGSELQIKYSHRVAKCKSDKPRINLTFRYYE